MTFIDYQDSRPIYEQIAEKYKLLILKGVLEPDERMPSVRQLAVQISANPNTVQRAYAELEREGFIYTVKGRGNFVSGDASLRDRKKEELAKKLDGVLEEAEDAGLDPRELLREAEARWRDTGKEAGKSSMETYVFSDEPADGGAAEGTKKDPTGRSSVAGERSLRSKNNASEEAAPPDQNAAGESAPVPSGERDAGNPQKERRKSGGTAALGGGVV